MDAPRLDQVGISRRGLLGAALGALALPAVEKARKLWFFFFGRLFNGPPKKLVTHSRYTWDGKGRSFLDDVRNSVMEANGIKLSTTSSTRSRCRYKDPASRTPGGASDAQRTRQDLWR